LAIALWREIAAGTNTSEQILQNSYDLVEFMSALKKITFENKNIPYSIGFYKCRVQIRAKGVFDKEAVTRVLLVQLD
jgi:hypothetical protein